MSDTLFHYLLYGWIGLALLIFPVLLRITPPYGRHTRGTWGAMMNNRWGWILMELPVLVVFSLFFWLGPTHKDPVMLIVYALFMGHYINRVFIFPLQLRGRNRKMPILIAVMAIFFNLFNGFFNGYWLGYLSPGYENSYMLDWRFMTGILFFLLGMYINIRSDQYLISLRKGKDNGYYIPEGGLFKYISSPNLFGEILEWLGWALICWSLPAFSFAIWTIANLVPRALDHHRWYKRSFPNYPAERKAVIPYIV